MDNINLMSDSSGASARQYAGDIITLRVIFKYNGLATSVLDPVLRIRNVDHKKDRSFEAVGTLPNNKGRTEWQLTSSTETMYTIQIDPLSLQPGFWKLRFEGKVSTGGKEIMVFVDGALQIDIMSRAGRIAHQIMAEMSDSDLDEFFAINGNYDIFKPSSLYGYIKDGVDWFNVTGPTETDYTMETFPEKYEFILKRYVRAQDALRRARVAIETDLQLSDAAHSLSQAKFEKYKGLYKDLSVDASEAVATSKAINPGGASTFVRNPLVLNYLGCTSGTSFLYMGSHGGYGNLPQTF